MPASDSERAPWRGRPKLGKSEQLKQRYSISIETQAALWFLAPTFLIVALLAIAGAWHGR
jgi:hypothetical protein